MKYFIIQPEVATELLSSSSTGLREEIAFSKDTRIRMVGWIGCAILEMHPYYFVTANLAASLNSANYLTGFEVASEVQVTFTDEFHERILTAFVPPPRLYLLNTGGTYLVDDFSTDTRGKLIVSQRGMGVLMQHNMFGLGIEEVVIP